MNTLSDLKIRASYGQVGNQGSIAPFRYLGQYGTGGNQLSIDNNGYPFNKVYQEGLVLQSLPNPNLKWKTSVQTDIGLDASFLNNKINFTADYYIKESRDFLLDIPVPSQTGFSVASRNVGSIRNSGLELALEYREAEREFQYGIGANITTVNNKILSLYDGLNAIGNIGGLGFPNVGGNTWVEFSRSEVGGEVGAFYGYKSDGIFQTQAEVDALDRRAAGLNGADTYYQASTTEPGDRRFEDLDGDGRITTEDRIIIGSPIPKFFGGLNLDATFKNFDFNMFWYVSVGNDIFNYTKRVLENFGATQGGIGLQNIGEAYYLNRWTPTNPSDVYPRVTRPDLNGNTRPSDAYVEDGSYLRLRNVQLGYTLPSSFTDKASISSVRILQYYEHYLTRGFKSSVDHTIHFGLGQTATVDSVEITWPDGKYQLLTNIRSNQVLQVDYKNATQEKPAPAPDPEPLFREATGEYNIAYKHEEDDYVDFKNQPLMPHKLTQNGPGITVGDVNGDGLDDFYVGGSGRHTGTVFFQDKHGKFSSQPLSSVPNKEDDMGALFFDADGDGDLDLYIATGGNEYEAGSESYRHRLYKNDGRGSFKLDERAIPHLVSSGSCVTAADFDKDGDLDLFIGGRNSPKKYPLPGQSSILRNDGGVFTNVTKAVCSELEHVGMVTSAIWTDFDHDSQIDLILVGEWMPISFFRNEKGKLTNVTSSVGLTNTNGWWNSIVAGDFDNDGDTDYVAGNLGLNSRYKASAQEPVSIYAKDFDSNGSVDPIVGYYINGESYPVATRDALTDQMVSMRRKFTRYSDYGNVTLDKMFSKKELEGAYIGKSYTFSSSYIENLGNGKFSMKALPMQAQFAPVFGMSVADVNNDNNLDVVLVGNSYATETGTGYYDASYGTVMIGNGKGGFVTGTGKATGFSVGGDAKAIAQLITAENKPLMLVSVNADSLKVFEESKAVNRQVVRLQPADAFADLHFKDGKKRREEFNYGSAYLSQSSRTLLLNSRELKEVFITNYQGRQRKVDLQQDLMVTKQ